MPVNVKRLLLFTAWMGMALGLIALTSPRLAHAATDDHGCPQSNVAVGSLSRPTIRRIVVCLMNEQRTSRDLPALRVSGALNHSAQRWTDTMVRTQDFTHGRDFAARISAAGFDWQWAGENIAVGYQTPWAVVQGWMASTGHCQNILAPYYSRVGTGVVDRGIGAYGAATWTQDFGLPMSSREPSRNSRPQDGCPYDI